MRHVMARLTNEECERARELSTLIRAYESGSVEAKLEAVQAAYAAELRFWDTIVSRYVLEEDESYKIDPVMGIVFVDPD